MSSTHGNEPDFAALAPDPKMQNALAALHVLDPQPAQLQLYDLIKDAERVTDITTHRFPTSLRRHYERLMAFPEGFLVLGDAVSSFNPIYAQGMTSAALQVQALQKLLNERTQGTGRLDCLAMTFFARAAEVVSTPWTLAANFDFAYPQTTGERPQGLEESARYFMVLEALCRWAALRAVVRRSRRER